MDAGERTRLLDQWTPLLAKIARRWWRRNPANRRAVAWCDLWSEVQTGFLEGLARHDEARGNSPHSMGLCYAESAACRYVKRELARGIRLPINGRFREYRVGSLSRRHADGDLVYEFLADRPVAREEPTERLWQLVREIVTERQYEILRMRFGPRADEFDSNEDIGREFGVTREAIRTDLARAFRKLRAKAPDLAEWLGET